MDELTKSIFYNYFDLLTIKEKAAYKASFAEEKAENLEPGKLQDFLRERSLTKTRRAKQCPKCFFSWHGTV
ncbi:MAG TPA: hypothetical protein VI750_04925 [Pyrinomonadaceae bacterium]|nr:hypothetical protein [Pyrinomonadaceae bacterium]